MKGKISAIFLCLLLAVTFTACGGYGTKQMQSSSGFQQTNLVSDLPGSASHINPTFTNPWGVAFIPGQTFWIANNDRGTANVFNVSGGTEAPAAVEIPVPPANTSHATPSGIVFNPIEEDFRVSGIPAQFIFATEDGTVSTWATINGSVPAIGQLAVDNSSAGAVYTGLAILTPQCCREYLALTNFHDGTVATYDTGFNLLATTGTFTDPDLPQGFAPFNIQQIGSFVFVTFALQDAAKHDPVVGAGNGIVDIFDQEGNFVHRFASHGALNAPWGIARAGANFGPFSNDILIGNFGDGTINAFDPNGNFVGQLKDYTGKAIINPGLWALVFRNDGVGDPNTLYFTAGPSNQQHGVFGAISFK